MSIFIPAWARADYALARAYLTPDGAERRLFAYVESSARKFHLTINHRGDDHFDPASEEIAWDPYSALRTTRGGGQSPALGLGHEIAPRSNRLRVKRRWPGGCAHDTTTPRRRASFAAANVMRLTRSAKAPATTIEGISPGWHTRFALGPSGHTAT